jgi:hypothetical protein
MPVIINQETGPAVVLFLQTLSLQNQSVALRTRKSVPKASEAIEPSPVYEFRPASAFG